MLLTLVSGFCLPVLSTDVVGGKRRKSSEIYGEHVVLIPYRDVPYLGDFEDERALHLLVLC